MKAKLDFKSKRTIIIASIIAVLAVGAGVGGYFYAKGNNQAGAANIDNGTSQNVSVDQGNSTKNSDNKKEENKNPDNKNDDNNGNVDNGNNADNGTNNDNTNNGNAANNGNNNGNANGGNAANNGGANNGNAAGNGGANNDAQNAGDDTDATTVIETVTDLNPWESHSVRWTPEALKVSTPNVDVNKPKLEIEKTAYVKGESLEGKPVNTVAQKGEDITFVIRIKNTGKLDASKVMVYDTIPEGTTLKENAEGTLQTIKDASGKEIQRIVWEKDVKAGETISVSFVVTVNIEEDEEIESINLIENKAKVNKEETNITKTPVITSKKVATLIEGKDEKDLTNDDFVKPGQTIKYTISAKNDTEVDGITKITDTVPDGTTLVEKSLDEKVVKTEKEVDGKKVITLEWKNVEVKAKKTTSVSFEVTVNKETPTKIRNVATVGETDTPPTENDVYIDITVNKKWEDKGNDVEHPDITVYLYQNDGERYFKQGTITKKDNDTYTFKDLPKFDENGNEYKYTIAEEAINTYKAEYNQDEFTITNTLETIDIPVEKKWDDKNINETYKTITITHPEITIKLKQGNKEFTSTKLNEANEFKDTFKNVPKYDPTGTEYSYKVEEVEVVGYDTDYSDDTYTITNTIKTTEISGTKKWEDANDQDGKRPTEIIVELYKTVENKKTKVTEKTVKGDGNTWDYEFTNLPVYENGKKITYTVDEVLDDDTEYEKDIDGTTITNSYTPETTEATVKKVWEDSNNQDGKRPTSLSVTLSNGKQVTLNTENGWTATVKDLPKYENKGQLITYTWTEGQLPEGYELTDTAVNGTVTTLTNTHEPEKTEASVKKVWDDADNQDGKRPASLEVTLSNGAKVILNEANGWTAKVENLPKYKDQGTEIVYTWTEGNMPEGYTLTKTEKDGTLTTLTNTREPEKTEVSVKKVWDDARNQDGKRPESLEVTLSNGAKVILNEANGWTAKVENLPKYTNGQEIVYTWTEAALPEGYELTGTSVNGTVTTLTNKHTPEKTEASVKKVWADSDNQDGKRPTSLEVTLSNGQKVTLNDGNEWTAKVENLPKYANGQEIAYTWTEGTMPTGYTLTDTSKNGTITTLTNSHTPEETEATVKKVWDDENNKENKRPTTLEVTLSNGQKVTLNAGNNWTAKVENLPKYANGTEIAYTWTEGTMPEEYELTDTSKNGTVTTLTNSIDWSSIEYEIPVTKIWYDGADAYGKRDDVVISVKAKNLTITKDSEGNDVYTVTNADPATYTEVTTVKLTESDLVSGTDSKWSKKVKVRKYDDNGKEIEYSVEEKSGPSDYTTEIEDNNTVSNAYNNVTIIEDRKGEISDQTYETRLDTVIVLDISGSMDHEGSSTPVEGTGWVYAKPYPISYSYWTMSGNHSRTFTDKDNPPTGIDESLIEYVDGQWCFKKGTTARKVSGDRWGYSITPDPYTNHQGNSNYEYVDIEFNNRIRAAVKAVNESINAVLYKEDGTRTNSRVALVVYSSSETGNSYNHFNSATMLPLGEYTPNENGEYIHLQQESGDYNDVVSVVAKTKNGGNVTGNTSSAKVAGGTYTQAGIKQVASILTSNTDEASRTYVSNGKTLSYIPVMILVTDGIPTYYNSQPNVVGDRSGTGYEEDHTQRHDEYTIKTAAFYKAKVSDVYKTECQVYTIGYGLSNNNDAKAMLNPGSSNKSSVLYSGQQYKNIKFDFTENSKTYHCVYDYANGASTTGEADTEAIIDAMKEVVEHIQTYVPSERRVSSLGNVKTAELTNLDRNQSIIIDLTDADGHETLHTYTYDELRTLGAITGDTVDFTNSLFNGAKYIMIEYKSTASAGAKFTRFIKSSETVDTIDMDTTNVPLTDKEIEEIEKELAEEAAEKENEEEKKKEIENNNIEENKEVEKTEKENVEEKDEKEDNKDEKEAVEEEKESNSDKEETEKEKVEEKEENKKEENNKENTEKAEKNEKAETTSTKSSSKEQEKSDKEEQETVKTEVTEENNN